MISNVRSNEKLDAILEKLNLARLDTTVLSAILLPLSLLSIGLIINWVVSPPLRTIQGLNTLLIIVEFMGLTFFVPLIVYAYGYVSDSMKFRLDAIKSLLIMLPVASSFSLFLGVETLQFFLKSKLPQFGSVLDFSISGLVLVAIAFTIVASFGVSSFVLSRLDNWLRVSIPNRVKREKIHLTPFLQFFVTIHPIMFAIFAGICVVGLVVFYLSWTIAILITSPLRDFWQEIFIAGWIFSVVPLIGFLARVKRLNRAFSRYYEKQATSSKNVY